MRFQIEVSTPQKLEFFPLTWLDKTVEEVRIVLNTPIGSVPYNRDFGMDMSFLHLPINLAKSAYATAAAEAIERFVPSLRVNQVIFPDDSDGANGLNPIIEVSSYE